MQVLQYYCRKCNEAFEWGREECPKCRLKVITGLPAFIMALLLGAGLFLLVGLVTLLEKIKNSGIAWPIIFVIFWHSLIMRKRRVARLGVRSGDTHRIITLPPEDWKSPCTDRYKEKITELLQKKG